MPTESRAKFDWCTGWNTKPLHQVPTYVIWSWDSVSRNPHQNDVLISENPCKANALVGMCMRYVYVYLSRSLNSTAVQGDSQKPMHEVQTHVIWSKGNTCDHGSLVAPCKTTMCLSICTSVLDFDFVNILLNRASDSCCIIRWQSDASGKRSSKLWFIRYQRTIDRLQGVHIAAWYFLGCLVILEWLNGLLVESLAGKLHPRMSSPSFKEVSNL